jgi:hypothetical protein
MEASTITEVWRYSIALRHEEEESLLMNEGIQIKADAWFYDALSERPSIVSLGEVKK